MSKLVVTREVAAPTAAVWSAWSEPSYLVQWWGPDGFSCPGAVIDFPEGGSAVLAMRAPTEFGGGESYSLWRFTSIEPQQRIELIHDLCDAGGTPVDPASARMPPDVPRAQRQVIELEDRGGSTPVTVTEHGWPEGQMREFSWIGMEQCPAEMEGPLSSGTGRTGRDADGR
jgi:uncharacterized protein YndB with AHSA1/START domain